VPNRCSIRKGRTTNGKYDEEAHQRGEPRVERRPKARTFDEDSDERRRDAACERKDPRVARADLGGVVKHKWDDRPEHAPDPQVVVSAIAPQGEPCGPAPGLDLIERMADFLG
jgi:hypothetical protein